MEKKSEEIKILIAEDEAPLLQILTDQITEAGLQVVGAKNGEEGLKLAQSEHPDLMLVDILMPKMDGLSMIAEIRKIPELKNTPVIVLTNLNDPASTARALEVGAYDYIVKTDTDIEDVVKRIKEKLGLNNP